MASNTKTIAFFGASTGIGLAALKHMLAAGHRCIALLRVPSKLTTVLSLESNPNLQVVQGNAHDIAAVSRCLRKEDGTLVDAIVSTIGAKPSLSKLGMEDAHVCGKGMTVLLEALTQLRKEGATGRPLVIALSSTGLSKFGRDLPVVMMPLYHVMLKVPHDDKRAMENGLIESDENFTIIRASFLVNGETSKTIKVGIEDPKLGQETKAIGYTISREDAGKWIAENLLLRMDAKYMKKVVSITY